MRRLFATANTLSLQPSPSAHGSTHWLGKVPAVQRRHEPGRWPDTRGVPCQATPIAQIQCLQPLAIDTVGRRSARSNLTTHPADRKMKGLPLLLSPRGTPLSFVVRGAFRTRPTVVFLTPRLVATVSDDEQLIEQALRGDSAAYGQLVRRYQDRLFTSLVHIVSSREEAEDVAQDTFVQAMLKLSSFRRDSSFYTWLYRIAVNTALHRQRRRRQASSVDATRALHRQRPRRPR